ncbi:uncharacterized protein LOC144136593 isoform X2 [Amblyomma americanum]
MRKTALLLTVLCLILAGSVAQEAGALQRRKPSMPPVFHTEQQLLQYLRELDDYYLFIGKPRFGRSVPRGK